MKKRSLITILIPAFNEEESLHSLYDRIGSIAKKLGSYDFEFLFIDDGSDDKTLEIIKVLSLKDHRVAYVSLSRNFGKEIAMIAGLDYSKGDATIIIDADLQDPPELISDMLKCWEQGYDDVYARRSNRKGESWIKKSTSSAFYKILQKSTNIPIQQDTGDFRLLSRRCVDALKTIRESQRYTKGMFSWIGYSKKELIYDRDPRIAGKTKWNYLKLTNLAIEGIISFTTAPLRLSTLIGLLVSISAFLYLIYLVVRTLFFGSDLAGYPSMMAVVLFIGGVQLLSLGIIGEYIARIFNETKNRPLYFTEEYHDSESQK